MSTDSILGQQKSIGKDILQKLLAWLDPVHEEAEEKYKQIRIILSGIFLDNGCQQVDKLVDETILRAFEDLKAFDPYPEDHKIVFRRVAKGVLRDYLNIWASTPEAFHRLLSWLDADGEQAARKYGQIHSTLCRIFITHGFTDAEGLADKAISRVIKKLPKIEKDYEGDPALYFSGVAKIICKEQSRLNELTRKLSTDYAKDRESFQPPFVYEDEENVYQKCLKECLSHLKPDERGLLLEYYLKEKGEKIKTRKDLASKMGITAINLRVRRHRVQTKLEECIRDCLKRSGTEWKPVKIFNPRKGSKR